MVSDFSPAKKKKTCFFFLVLNFIRLASHFTSKHNTTNTLAFLLDWTFFIFEELSVCVIFSLYLVMNQSMLVIVTALGLVYTCGSGQFGRLGHGDQVSYRFLHLQLVSFELKCISQLTNLALIFIL
jgi:hypothetical protein